MKPIMVAVIVGGEKYFFPVATEDERKHSLRCAGRWASNPELAFTWYDAAILSAQVHAVGSRETANGGMPEAVESRRTPRF